MEKTVFITGATAGFGAACARRYAAAGWRLVLTGRRSERLAALQQELGAKTPVHTLILDLCRREAVEALPEALPEPFRQVDVLLNNAGLALGLEPAAEASLDDWETMIDTNVKGLVFCTRRLLPAMVARNRGHIVNIGSTAGNWPYPGSNVYGSTKAFVQQFSRNLRADLLGSRVRVTHIAPGMAETEFSQVRFHGDAERAARVYAGTEPLTPEDIAEAVFWVTSLPERVNVNALEIMPTCQAWGPLAVHREG